MLFDDLKSAKMAAMKEHNKIKSDTLGLVISKAMLTKVEKKSKGEDLTDADVVGIIQKTVKELEEERNDYVKLNRQSDVDNANAQIECISEYLPKMMSADEIKQIILSMDDKSVGSVMKKFKTEYAGKVEMRLVQEVLKSI